MNRNQFTHAGANAPPRAQPHSYENSRPFSVFALAAVAMFGVLGMTWSAHAALTRAAAEEQISPPPDLKKVLERLEEAAGTLIQRSSAV